MAKRFDRRIPVISEASSDGSWAPSRRAGRRSSAAMSSNATIAVQPASLTTRAATATVPSARDWRGPNGSRIGKPSCCQCRTSMSSSRCRRRSARSRSRTSPPSMRSCSARRPQTLATIAADPRHLGAKLGMTMVLHTWGQTLQHHPHVHCVVPGGGPSLDGTRWVACRPGFFLPVRVLSRLFRRLFLQELENAFVAGKLRFFGKLANLAEPAAFAERLGQLQRLNWVVYAKQPFGGPQQVLAYLGRYTHRVAIANSRLISLADGKVRFTWKDYRADGKTKVMTLDADEFIRRFLLHTLPDSFHRIRHYGFLANGSRNDNIAHCRRLLEATDSSVCETADNRTQRRSPIHRSRFRHLSRLRRHHAADRNCAALLQPCSHSSVTRHDRPADTYRDRTRPQRCGQQCPHRHRAADQSLPPRMPPVPTLEIDAIVAYSSRAPAVRTNKLAFRSRVAKPSSNINHQPAISHYPHSAQPPAASFNPASLRSRSSPCQRARRVLGHATSQNPEDSQISISMIYGWSAFGGADHGWQDVGLEEGAWTLSQAFSGSVGSQGAATNVSTLRVGADRSRRPQEHSADGGATCAR